MDIRKTIIGTALVGIAHSGVGRLFPNAIGNGIIFTLHHVRPEQPREFRPNQHLEITPEFLELAIVTAKQAGFKPVPLTSLVPLLQHATPGERYCSFTLDDGYRNNARHAAPLFRKYDIPYTIFVCPGFVERTRILWWEAAADIVSGTSSFTFDFGSGLEHVHCDTMSSKRQAFDRLCIMVETLAEDDAVARISALALANGIDPMDTVRNELMDASDLADLAQDPLSSFGAHTMTHCNLARVEDERLQREINDPRPLIEAWTGKAPQSFAYPYGWARAAGPREFAAVQASGFSSAVTTQPAALSPNCLPQALPRLSLNGYYQKPSHLKALLTGVPFKLR